MEYTVLKLGKLAGISTRTLRYYDEIGLLHPQKVTASGYRVYGEKEVDALQQILYFRELDIPLTDIKAILNAPSFDQQAALNSHLAQLKLRRDRLDRLIQNVEKTIFHEKGSITMSNKEKFEAFKKDLVQGNEKKYGSEIRQKYGNTQVDESNARMLKQTQEEYDTMHKAEDALLNGLENAVKEGLDPSGPEGLRLAALHKDWLSYTWKQYAKEAHLGLAQMYVEDERFTVYYDKNVKGCAQFLRDAISAFVQK